MCAFALDFVFVLIAGLVSTLFSCPDWPPALPGFGGRGVLPYRRPSEGCGYTASETPSVMLMILFIVFPPFEKVAPAI
jgi:hypothetical protein